MTAPAIDFLLARAPGAVLPSAGTVVGVSDARLLDRAER